MIKPKFASTIPKQKPIKKVSSKRAEQNKTYKMVRAMFLNDNYYCQRCRRPASEIHHKAGRNGERLNDVHNFMSVCRDCHQYIHAHPQESRQNGWLK